MIKTKAEWDSVKLPSEIFRGRDYSKEKCQTICGFIRLLFTDILTKEDLIFVKIMERHCSIQVAKACGLNAYIEAKKDERTFSLLDPNYWLKHVCFEKITNCFFNPNPLMCNVVRDIISFERFNIPRITDIKAKQLAMGIYEANDFNCAGILRDRLEEIDGPKELIEHLMQPFHTFGCWAFEEVLK